MFPKPIPASDLFYLPLNDSSNRLPSMSSPLFSSSSTLLFSLLSAFLVLSGIPSSHSNELHSSCSSPFSCGNITDVGYPFWGSSRASGCGYPDLELSCENNTTAKVVIGNVDYKVLGVYPQTQVLKISRQDYSNGLCSPQFANTTLDPALYDLAPGYMNFTFVYGCPPNGIENLPGKFSCSIDEISFKDGYMVPGAHGPAGCFGSVVVPVSQGLLTEIGNSSNSLAKILQEGFEVKLKVDDAACGDCTRTSGVCGYDSSVNQTTCYCADQSSGSGTCSSSSAAGPQGQKGSKNQVSLVIGLGFAGVGITGLLLGLWIYSLRAKRSRKREAAAAAAESRSKDISGPPSSKGLLLISATSYSRTTPSYLTSKSDLEKGSTYFGVQVFSYVELEEATHNFDPARELGDGGFGTVYYGELHDGRVVAVKRLYENNMKRVEQFMNEVEILTRLRHQNLVTLFGCTSRRSRELLLVYEFIPNGTVADHLHGKRAGSGLFPWRIRLNIAIETADALAYLHESDVIHRDVKTNNILLDNNFSVKVADFGLSRLFPNDVTHVSTAPQGTPGYVDPEYYQCYQLTDKSDVYSFGVVLCELLSSKPAVDTNRHRHDINLANMAVKMIQNHTLPDLVDPSIGFETDYSVRRMATLVAELAFRCLQQEKDLRPTMLEVLESLRRIKNEENSFQSTEVVEMDIQSDDCGLLKNNIVPPPLSPDSAVTEKWASSSSPTLNSF